MRHCLVALLIGVGAAQSAAAAPPTVSHQGRLFDASGTPLSGTHTLEARLYDVATGGASLWSETHVVDFDNGYFHVVLGTVGPLGPSDFDASELYLGLAVDALDELPRVQLHSVPWALSASQATDVIGGVVDVSEIRVGGQLVADSSGTVHADWSALSGIPAGFSDGVDDSWSPPACGENSVLLEQGGQWGCHPASGHAHDAADLSTGLLATDRLPMGVLPGTVARGDHAHNGVEAVACSSQAEPRYDPSTGDWRCASAASVSPRDFGAVGDGVADDTAAVDAALGSGARVIVLDGAFRYVGQLVVPPGTSIRGESFTHSALNVEYDGFAVVIEGSGTSLDNFTLRCSRNGIIFSTVNRVSTLNQVSRVRILGPGRAADSTGATSPTRTVGIHLDRARNNLANAAYYNTLDANYIRGFDVAVYFDAPPGASAHGGNGNRALNNQISDYWIGYDIQGMENEIAGGFFNNSLGNSSTDYGIAYKLSNGAYYNMIHPAIGEPGDKNVRVWSGDGAWGNEIASTPSNYNLGDHLEGGELITARFNALVDARSLSENTYYTQQITRTISATEATALVDVHWAAKAASVAASSAGHATLKLSYSGGALTAEWLDLTQLRKGASVMLAGVMIGTDNSAHLVWHARNNGTSTQAGELSADISFSSTGGIRRRVDMTMTPVGTTNPSTLAVPVYDAPQALGTIAPGTAKVLNISVPATRVGDDCRATYSQSTAGLMMSSTATGPDAVEVLFFNPTSASVSPTSGRLAVTCLRPTSR